MAPVLTIVPAEALPPWMPSTNHVSVALPPDIVAVNSCDWEVVTAVRCGDRKTVMVLGAGGLGVGVGEVEEFLLPQEVSPGKQECQDKSQGKNRTICSQQRRITIPKRCQHHGVSRTKIVLEIKIVAFQFDQHEIPIRVETCFHLARKPQIVKSELSLSHATPYLDACGELHSLNVSPSLMNGPLFRPSAGHGMTAKAPQPS